MVAKTKELKKSPSMGQRKAKNHHVSSFGKSRLARAALPFQRRRKIRYGYAKRESVSSVLGAVSRVIERLSFQHETCLSGGPLLYPQRL